MTRILTLVCSPHPICKNSSVVMEAVLRFCADGTEPDLRNEAAAVLLSIVELAVATSDTSMVNNLLSGHDPETSPRSEPYAAAGATATLHLLAESFDSSLTVSLKARAQQAIRDLAEKGWLGSRGADGGSSPSSKK